MTAFSNEQRRSAVLTGALADDAWPAGLDAAAVGSALAAYAGALVGPVVEAHRGRLASPLTATFDSAADAWACAREIQRCTAAGAGGENADCGLLVGWTLAEEGEDPGIVPPCEPGGISVSPAVAAAVGQPRSTPGLDGTAMALHATVVRPASDAVRLSTWTGPRPPEPAPSGTGLRPGGLLNDTYEIEEMLASGGMGEVFRGREIHSGGLVAVKVIRLDMAHHPSALSLFQKEALTLRDINHDAIVRYYSFSFDPGLGRHYLVMEFVDGPPLSRLLEAGPMPVDAVALLCRRVAAGLQLAHERGIVHRDLSPDNIILPSGEPGRAKIIDFGIARAAAIGGGTIINGGFAGKNSYVSPEHLGLAGGEVTAKSDIYSLGIVLAEACLGRQLDMAGTQVDVIEKRRSVPDLAGVDPRLRGLIARMLDPDPERRPGSMAAVAEAAHLPVDRSVVSSRPETAPARRIVVEKPRRRIERWIVGTALALVLAWGAGLYAYGRWFGPVSPPRTESASANLPRDKAPAPVPPEPHADAPEKKDWERPPSPVTPSLSMADYVRTYEGGECFFLRPIRLTATSAALDAFALSKEAFAKLDRSFQHQFDVSPDIVGSRIWSRQCPALDFLRRTAPAGTVPPKLFVKSARVGRGQPVAGEIRGADGRSVALLVVGENGTVRDATDTLKPDGDALTFELTPAPDAAGPAPELLMAVASPGPLPALAARGPLAADALFQAILGDASRQGAPLAADAKLFIVGG